MNNQGFPKNPIYCNLRGETFDTLALVPCSNGQLHSFELSGTINKHDDSSGSPEVVILHAFFCVHCLLHVFSEVQRFALNEVQTQDQAVHGLLQ